jgi:hypothetical protein
VEELVKVMHVLAESHPQLTHLALDNQFSVIEGRIDTVASTIKQLHDRKLAINYLSDDHPFNKVK